MRRGRCTCGVDRSIFVCVRWCSSYSTGKQLQSNGASFVGMLARVQFDLSSVRTSAAPPGSSFHGASSKGQRIANLGPAVCWVLAAQPQTASERERQSRVLIIARPIGPTPQTAEEQMRLHLPYYACRTKGRDPEYRNPNAAAET